MNCNNCLQEIISGEDFYEDEAEGTKYHVNCKKAAIDRRDKAEARVTELQAEFDVALDRVGELQAELAAHRAAHRWRPVTEEWPPYDKCVPVRMRNGAIRWGFRRGDFWHLTVGKYGREGVTHAYVLPPAPQETE